MKNIVLVVVLACAARAGTITNTYTGNVDVTVASYATAGTSGAGTLSVSGLPAGATILNALLLTDNYFSDTGASAIFNGNNLGAGTAFANDGGAGNLVDYSWDVTSLVSGNGSFNASYAGPNNTYGLTLVVVYSSPLLPSNRVQVLAGAQDVCGASTCNVSNQFTGFNAGPGTLWIHTGADNALGESNETINFNGTAVGGPIDANLGNFASLFQISVNTVSGNNGININSPQNDQFDWNLAVLSARGTTDTTTPEPATFALIGAGLIAVASLRRKSVR